MLPPRHADSPAARLAVPCPAPSATGAAAASVTCCMCQALPPSQLLCACSTSTACHAPHSAARCAPRRPSYLPCPQPCSPQSPPGHQPCSNDRQRVHEHERGHGHERVCIAALKPCPPGSPRGAAPAAKTCGVVMHPLQGSAPHAAAAAPSLDRIQDVVDLHRRRRRGSGSGWGLHHITHLGADFLAGEERGFGSRGRRDVGSGERGTVPLGMWRMLVLGMGHGRVAQATGHPGAALLASHAMCSNLQPCKAIQAVSAGRSPTGRWGRSCTAQGRTGRRAGKQRFSEGIHFVRLRAPAGTAVTPQHPSAPLSSSCTGPSVWGIQSQVPLPGRTAGLSPLITLHQSVKPPSCPPELTHLHHGRHAARPDLVKHRLELRVLAAQGEAGGKKAGHTSGQWGGCRPSLGAAAAAAVVGTRQVWDQPLIVLIVCPLKSSPQLRHLGHEVGVVHDRPEGRGVVVLTLHGLYRP